MQYYFNQLVLRQGRIYSLLFFFSLFLSPILSAQSLTFSNFSQPQTLLKGQGYYRLLGRTEKFLLANRLIVKTTKAINKQQLSQYHDQIVRVTELFVGQAFRYFVLELRDQALLSVVLTQLQGKTGIELIQPDILQLKQTSAVTTWGQETAVNLSRVSGGAGSAYIDLLGLEALWQQSTGQGVKVAVIDDGFELQHPDLRHISPGFSYDVARKVLASTPVSPLDHHGTKVAGIIFAAHNNMGIDGIAPAAELIAIRQPDSWTSNTLLSFHLASLAGADIINCSWHSQWLLQPVAEVVTELSEKGRRGKGIAVIVAAGNQGQKILAQSSEAAIDVAIVVGAADQYGKRLPFSNYGPSVDFLNYGKKSKTTLKSRKYGDFSGTSLAAAITSGVAALLLSTRPEMTVEQLLQQLTFFSAPGETKDGISAPLCVDKRSNNGSTKKYRVGSC